MRFGDLATFDSNNKNKNQIITQNKVIMAKKKPHGCSANCEHIKCCAFVHFLLFGFVVVVVVIVHLFFTFSFVAHALNTHMDYFYILLRVSVGFFCCVSF